MSELTFPPPNPYSTTQLLETASKRDLLTQISNYATREFIEAQKLNAEEKSLLKGKKSVLEKAYAEMHALKAYRKEDEPIARTTESENKENKEEKVVHVAEVAEKAVVEEVCRFKKTILKKGKGDKPSKKTVVAVLYTGKFTDTNEVFDTNIEVGAKKQKVLRFKLGTGAVIRGWDEGILTMLRGEKAQFIIEPEWGYGKEGKKDAGIPSNASLTFDIELVDFN